MRASLIRRNAIASTAIGVCLSTAACAQSVQPLTAQGTAHIAKAIAQAVPVAVPSQGSPMHLSVVLPLRNTGALQTLLKNLYDPASPSYHHFLTPGQFAAQFGPTQSDYDTVTDYMVKHNFRVAATSPNRVVLSVEGPVEAVQSTFHVNELIFQRSDLTSFYAPDRTPAVSSDLSVPIVCVGGLDNANPPHRIVHYDLSPNALQSNGATGPFGTFSPLDFRKAYDVPSTLDGTGQSLAIWSGGGVLASDITTFEDQFGLRHVPIKNVSVDGTVPDALPSGEDTIDVESEVGIASGATSVLIYLGGSPVEKLNRQATDDIANQFNNSYGYDAGTDAGEGQIYAEMAAQGQSNFVATGDAGAWDTNSQNPQDQPYVTGVGGTALSTDDNGNWLTETTWGGSGGGVSPLWPIPWYQQTIDMSKNGGSTKMRNGPDVSADANFGISFFLTDKNGGHWGTGVGGTSFASPWWAGLTALVNQMRASEGMAPIGLLNPTLTEIGQGPRYHTDFHDIADGSNNQNSSGLEFKAVAGFDLTTGWGTPIAANLIQDLAGAPSVSLVSATTGKVTLKWLPITAASKYNIYRGTAAGKENAAPYTTTTTTTFTDTGVTDGTTYYYYVTAVISSETPKSNEINALPLDIPTHFTGVLVSTGDQLTWTAVKGATSYRIYRGSSATALTTLQTTTATTFIDTAVQNGSTYYYTVTALGPLANEESGQPAPVSVTVHGPGTPSGLIATALNNSVALSWTAGLNAALYNVGRATSAAGPFTIIARPASVKYTDTDAQNGVTYYYEVSSINPIGQSANTAVAHATPNANYTAPATPTGLMAAAATGSVTLKWTAAARATTYTVTRSTKAAGPYVAVGTSASTTYTDSTPVKGTTYYYEVAATNAYGTSALSAYAGAVAK